MPLFLQDFRLLGPKIRFIHLPESIRPVDRHVTGRSVWPGEGWVSRQPSSASFPAVVWLLGELSARTGKLHRCSVTKNRRKVDWLNALNCKVKAVALITGPSVTSRSNLPACILSGRRRNTEESFTRNAFVDYGITFARR